MNLKNITLALLIFVVLAVTGLGYWFFLGKSEGVLISKINESQLQNVVRYLDEKGIDYTLEDNSDIVVAKDIIPSVRMEMVEKGVIQSDRVGFEIFTEADYGMTEFAQKVNYQRALQGELEKSILTIEGVKFARVHLILPKKGTLFSKTRDAAASVLIHLESGMELNQISISGVQLLVSGAVEELQKDDVTVVDRFGRVLTLSEDSAVAYGNSHQSGMKGDVERLLSQWYSPIDFSVSLSVVKNSDTREKTIEKIAPDGKRFLVNQKESSSEVGQQKNGTTINKNVENQFGYSKETEVIQFAKNKIDKVRCAIVFSRALTTEELSKIKSIVAAAIGFDPARGDTLEISSTSVISTPIASEPNLVESSITQEPVTALVDPVPSTVSHGKKDTYSLPKPESFLEKVQNDPIMTILLMVNLVLLFLVGFILLSRHRSKSDAKRQQEEMIEKLKVWASES